MNWTPEKIRKFRQWLGGISQKEFADKLGVGEATIIFWERRPSKMAIEKLDALVKELDYDPERV